MPTSPRGIVVMTLPFPLLAKPTGPICNLDCDYCFFRDDLDVRFMQFIPIVERVTETLLPLANLGWSAQSKEKRPLYLQQGHHTAERTVDASTTSMDQYG